jgi:aminopeptidase N
MKTETQPIRLEDYRAPDFRIDTVNLDFRLDPTATRVIAKLALRRREPGDAPLILLGDDLRLTALSLDGTPLAVDAYEATPEQLVIHAPPDGPFTLTVETEIDPSANTELMGLYRSSQTYCTQCEAEGFRRITYFLDRPDVLAVYTTRIEALRAEAPELLSNGNLVETGDVPGDPDRHYAIWRDPFPKPSYLFALVAGDLAAITDTFTTMSGRQIELSILCEHGKEERCRYAMDSLKRAMRWDEEVFGREYDLDIFNIVAVSDFNMGAMENKGLNVFNDRFVLADAETATDVDYNHIEGVIAHEYFHNWTGNRITCRDWFQLCLKEGLTVYRDQEFSSDMQSRAVKRIDDVRTLKARQFPEDGGPLAHPVRPEIYHEINNFYTATVYEKGAEVVRMIHTLLGPDGFRNGMDLYFERHDGEAATVEDFLAAFADANGVDLGQFKLWYSQAGTPDLVARGSYDAAQRRYTLTLGQSTPATPGQPNKQPLHVPIRFGLVGANGGDLSFDEVTGATVTGDVIHLTGSSQTIVFHGVSERPVPSLLRGFSAPVRLSLDLGTADLLFLLRADNDTFNRWQAAQTLAMRALTAATAVLAAGETVDHSELVAALGDVAANDALDPALRAQVLALPTEAEVAREIGRDVDPDAVAAARNDLRAQLGSWQADKFRRLHESLAGYEPYRPDAASQGRRALRNVALDLLIAGDASLTSLAARQVENADNMTDRMAALATLNRTATPERETALADFRDRYAGDPLVLDKWLALEAMAPLEGTLNRVRALMGDSAFSIENPNRVRALIGSFATANQTQFNRADGAGYDFVADIVLQLDRKNPQTAARLLISFRSWRALESGRRAAAETALRRIADTSGLSPDVADIITRILA